MNKHLFLKLAAVLLPLFITISPVSAITPQEADLAIDSYNAVYWNASRNVFYKNDDKTETLDFWMYAHAWETEMDAYERTRDTTYLNFINNAFDGFTDMYGTDWSGNQYNDDIMWWSIACSRAYTLTGDTTYSSISKSNFDWVIETQYDTILGGGVWWLNSEHASKHACVNGPAICAALHLYRIYDDESYLDLAAEIYDWMKETLYDNGRIYDNIRLSDGRINTARFTYNQGTMIGGALGLFQEAGDSSYLDDAFEVIEYTRDEMCNSNGILPAEGASNDTKTFKTVFVHYMMRFIMDLKHDEYLAWMNTNAESVWSNRRTSDNIMWYDWTRETTDDNIMSMSASGGPALLNLIVLAETPTAITVDKKKPSVVMPGINTRLTDSNRLYSLHGKVIQKSDTKAIHGVWFKRLSNGKIIKQVTVE